MPGLKVAKKLRDPEAMRRLLVTLVTEHRMQCFLLL
jgi:hypothetical protein